MLLASHIICLGTLLGSELITSQVHAPLSKFEHVFVLPMSTVSMTMGTAVVTSVPSDSPDDYMSYHSLQTKLNGPDAKAYGITTEHVAFPPNFQIIAIPGYDGCAAPIVCERLKVGPRPSLYLTPMNAD